MGKVHCWIHDMNPYPPPHVTKKRKKKRKRDVEK